jgi:crossover junction endodeoxyribonuclease RuvC
MSIILGIDPGSQRTGYGLIKTNKGKSYYLASGCILAKGSLSQLFEALKAIIEQYHPNEAAIEQVFCYKNPRSALVLGQARGAILVALELAKLPITGYAARQIKQATVGYGAATKEQMQHMVQQLLQLSGLPGPDAADALAIALCHANSSQISTQVQTVKKSVNLKSYIPAQGVLA